MDGIASADAKRFGAPVPNKQTAKVQKQESQKLTKKQIEAMKQMNKVVDEKKAERTVEQEAAERAQLLRKIQNYQKHFPEKTAGLAPKRMSVKHSATELKTIVEQIETELGMSGGIEFVVNSFSNAGSVLENLTDRWNPLGLQLRGPISLDQTLRANRANWEPLAVEFAIKYERWFCMGVEARIISFFATLVLTVHRANSSGQAAMAAAAAGKGKEEMSPDLAAEADQLFEQ